MNTIIINDTFTKHKEELNKYLSLIGIDNAEITLSLSDFPSAKNDAYTINIKDNKGIITANTSIALLNGIYRMFEEMGCRFLRPGKYGERIPSLKTIPDINVFEEASFFHRGMCIEGAVSEKHVINMIDWEAKNGMNSYFTQFRQSHTFFDRWYAHIYNPHMDRYHISIGKADEYLSEIVSEIKSRGMLYQAVGHGWTCEPFGYAGLGWDQVDYEIKEKDKVYFALINGKRDFWNKLPINTNLCYSNPKVREIIVNDIVNYLKEHKSVDILHLWLADDYNNHCTCDECQKMRPSDYYVMMLNELDKALTDAGLKTRIVFLIYFDLLWAPEKTTIINQDRFIIMFAPITRTWLESFETVQNPKPPCPYVRNNITVPSTDEEFVGLYNSWREMFKGDSFNFDYYLMWFHVKDATLMNVSKLISKDIKCYNDLSLNGLISCQVQRIFFPTSLPMYVMAKTLWNKNLSYEEIEEDYFKSAFGREWEYAKKFMTNLGDLFLPEYLVPKITKDKEHINNYINVINYAEQNIEKIYDLSEEIDDIVSAYSWLMLFAFAKLIIAYAKTLTAYIRDDKEHFNKNFTMLKEVICENDNCFNEQFDGWGYINVLNGIFADMIN